MLLLKRERLENVKALTFKALTFKTLTLENVKALTF
jgi:hypothetical protein